MELHLLQTIPNDQNVNSNENNTNSYLKTKKSLHQCVRMDQTGRPLPPKQFSILEGLTLNLVNISCNILIWFIHCALVCVIELIWTLVVYNIFELIVLKAECIEFGENKSKKVVLKA